ARHAGGEDAGSRHELVTERAEAVDRRRSRRDALRAEDERLATFGAPEDRGQVAARPVRVRLDDLEREAGGDDGVEGVAAALEHGHPGCGGEPVGRGDHPERALQLGAGGERHRRASTARARPDDDNMSFADMAVPATSGTDPDMSLRGMSRAPSEYVGTRLATPTEESRGPGTARDKLEPDTAFLDKAGTDPDMSRRDMGSRR